jgi:hypothetical protein
MKQQKEEQTLKKLKLSSEEEEEEEIPAKFKCPITHEVMQEPVCIADGSVYERSAINKWFKNKDTSPLTNLYLEHTEVCPNKELLEQIKESKWYKPLPPIPSFIKDSQYSFTSGQSGWFFVVFGYERAYSIHADVVFDRDRIELIRNDVTELPDSDILGTYTYNKEKDCYMAPEDLGLCYVLCLKTEHENYVTIHKLVTTVKVLDGKIKQRRYFDNMCDITNNVIIYLLGYDPVDLDSKLKE